MGVRRVRRSTHHDRHALLGDTGVRVDLLEHLVDVRAVRLGALRGCGDRWVLGACGAAGVHARGVGSNVQPRSCAVSIACAPPPHLLLAALASGFLRGLGGFLGRSLSHDERGVVDVLWDR